MQPLNLRQQFKRLLVRSLFLTACGLALAASPCFAQEIDKKVLDHIRAVSVSIEHNGKAVGSGTLFEKDGETWCVTAAHVSQVFGEGPVTVAQHQEGKPAVSVYAVAVIEDEDADVAFLKLGKGVFKQHARFHHGPCPELDSPIVHCGSMRGMHHTVTRGYLMSRDRKSPINGGKRWQADLTATYGSSGGGVFSACGQFIGMVTEGDPQRIILFVPLSTIREVLDQEAD